MQNHAADGKPVPLGKGFPFIFSQLSTYIELLQAAFRFIPLFFRQRIK